VSLISKLIKIWNNVETSLIRIIQNFTAAKILISSQHTGERSNFAPPPTKTAEFKVKNLHQSGEKAKAEHLLYTFL